MQGWFNMKKLIIQSTTQNGLRKKIISTDTKKAFGKIQHSFPAKANNKHIPNIIGKNKIIKMILLKKPVRMFITILTIKHFPRNFHYKAY